MKKRLSEKMSKGAIGIVALIVLLGLILLVEFFIVSYFVRFEYVVGRFMAEVPLLAEADKIETYVRSFQNAVELSLLQGIYNIKNQSQELWYDFGSKMPDENKIEEMIVNEAREEANEYLREYREFARANAKEIEILSSISGGDVEWNKNKVSIKFDSISFKAEKDSLVFDRVFEPSGRVRTKFKLVWDLSKSLIENDEIGKRAREKIVAEINSEDQCTIDNINSKLDENFWSQFENEFNTMNTEKIVIDVRLEKDSTEASPILNPDGSFDHCQFTIVVTVTMEDHEYKHIVFDGAKVKEDFLGLIYRIRTGS
jgi:hypothetical protein